MRPIPENLLRRALPVPVNSKPSIAIMSKISVFIYAKASSACALRQGAGVRAGQADGRDFVLDDV